MPQSSNHSFQKPFFPVIHIFLDYLSHSGWHFVTRAYTLCPCNTKQCQVRWAAFCRPFHRHFSPQRKRWVKQKHLLLSPHVQPQLLETDIAPYRECPALSEIFSHERLSAPFIFLGSPPSTHPSKAKDQVHWHPNSHYIACKCLLFNSSGFLRHGFKASFVRFRRLIVQVHMNISLINTLRGKKGPATQKHSHKRFPEQ